MVFDLERDGTMCDVCRLGTATNADISKTPYFAAGSPVGVFDFSHPLEELNQRKGKNCGLTIM